MSVVYSLYDALVSIHVPTEKARAVIDAMEREMMNKVATKSDLAHVQELLSRDIQAVGKDIQSVKEALGPQIKAAMAALENKMTARLTVIMAGLIGAATALISAVEYFH